MGRLIVQMQMSVDGYVEASDPTVSWQLWDWGADWPWDRPLRDRFNATFERADAILLSRPMVEEGYLAHWAGIADAMDAQSDFRFAHRITELDKVVLSSRPIVSHWERTTVVPGGFLAGVESLKADDRTYVTFGGVGFVSALIDVGAVDELELFINPAAAGGGRSIFPPRGIALELLESAGFASGIVVNRYRSAAARAPHSGRGRAAAADRASANIRNSVGVRPE
ncbi:dihydrofolate reductase family protein [Leifsonia poae]|uniref:dihydrofolate reductase family protein n=1 Tax=Leifsonia poae TaxID=110933 RepID=UPI001CBC0099|nr:dihydrofolate reductase family protein [Leifsonia poae]